MLIGEETKVLVQGITGRQGRFHAERMKRYGTDVVAGVTPGKGGKEVHGIPVYNSVEDALDEHEVDWSIGFVPARFAKDAAFEALNNGLNTCVITENVPVHDSIDIQQKANEKGLKVVGPNCPGLIAPGKCKIGIMPGSIFREGSVGVVSRSGTLTYEIVDQLSRNGYGQSLAVGIGGDPVIGLDFLEVLEMFERDPETEKIVLIGEIGGEMEEKAAEMIDSRISKDLVAYIAGRTAPKGKKMGHAGAIVHGDSGTAESKVEAFEEIGISVARLPSEVPELL
ncbi:MAG: succinate--CoA ligase subunit alpha [Candidatus Nanohaloarchaea archaeon]|nr:succinate--CoA ligase subunit alpha [Candidatus Nanohaloarchaea archaeon]